jgi:hypothetical protein
VKPDGKRRAEAVWIDGKPSGPARGDCERERGKQTMSTENVSKAWLDRMHDVMAGSVARNDVRRGTPRLTVRLKHFPPGWAEAPAAPHTVVCLHVGPAVQMFCRRGAETFRGTEVPSDIKLVPVRVPSAWKADKHSTGLLMSLPPAQCTRSTGAGHHRRTVRPETAASAGVY